MAGPIYRGQGNQPFKTNEAVRAARRGQTVPYDTNGAPTPAAGAGYTVTTKMAGYTETANGGEIVVLCALAAGFTVILPSAVGNTAKLSFKKMLAAGSIVIAGAGSETIDGGLTATLTAQYEAITLVSDGANWAII
jgi:hypothetical protein